MPVTPIDASERPRVSRRNSIIGSVLAVLALAGLGWLAWHLTRPASETTANAGPAGAGARRGPPSTTVGVATADLFPRVSVTGFVGFLSGTSTGFGNAASKAWSVAPSTSRTKKTR